jgi:hypothetical protein
MTGNRVAHPLLISLANIDMDFRMKALNYCFLLCALLPIAKFKIKNKAIRGVLERRLYHEFLDFVLFPLKQAARVGIMLSDAFGKRRWCFTPLASHIVDTPESQLSAGVAANASPITTATYKQFGDSFRHPYRTAEYTLSLLKKLEAVVHPWRDLPQYAKLAKAWGLNGVHRPFWRDWALSEPYRFLTPEILHHWHKFFFDHEVKWCLRAVSDPELDRRFSSLHPHTGMRHFKEGISHAKQVTGREHRDIQRYLIPAIAGAEGISRDFLNALSGMNDFRYEGQAPEMDEHDLSKMDAALGAFHKHKQAILDSGVRKGKNGPLDHWHIPKLELLQSVVPSIRANGVPLQWSADVTEHTHITMIKDPVSYSNNQNHEPQICRHLDRRDKVAQFDLATAMMAARVDMSGDSDDPCDPYEDDGDGPVRVNTASELLEIIEPAAQLGTSRRLVNYFTIAAQLSRGEFPKAPKPFRTFTSTQGNTAFHLTRDPVGRQLSIHDASGIFKLPDLEQALIAYLHRVSHKMELTLAGRRPTLKDARLPFEAIQIWHSVRLQSLSFHDPTRVLLPQTVNASPPDEIWRFGRGDAVIVSTNPQHKWPRSGLQGQ